MPINCDHSWTAENIRTGEHSIQAIVVCLRCNTIKKPLGANGADIQFAIEGSKADLARAPGPAKFPMLTNSHNAPPKDKWRL